MATRRRAAEDEDEEIFHDTSDVDPGNATIPLDDDDEEEDGFEDTNPPAEAAATMADPRGAGGGGGGNNDAPDPQAGPANPNPNPGGNQPQPQNPPPVNPAAPVPEPAVTQAEIRAATKETGIAKSSITRIRNTLVRLCDDAEDLGLPNINSTGMATRMNDSLDKLDQARSRYDRALGNQIALDPTVKARAEAVQIQIDADCDAVISRASIILGQIPSAVRANPAPPRGQMTAAAVVKANMALKPDILLYENSPIELDRWLKMFEAFYRTSNLSLLSLQDQHAYFLAYLDQTLPSLIEGRITLATTVLGETESCFAELKAIFYQRYPLYRRRSAFFDATFAGGIRDIPSFLTQLEKLADAAQVQGMGRDHIIAFRALSAIKDKEIRRLAFRVENVTLEVVKDLALQRIREVESAAPGYENGHIQVVQQNKKEVICYYCKNKGHYAANCRKKQHDMQRQVPAARQVTQGEEEEEGGEEEDSPDAYPQNRVRDNRRRKPPNKHRPPSNYKKGKGGVRAVQVQQEGEEEPEAEDGHSYLVQSQH